jgi:hypothetical protein
MNRRSEAPVQLACGGFLATAMVLDWLSVQVLSRSRTNLDVILPVVMPCLLGLLGVVLTTRLVSTSIRRVVIVAVGAGALLGLGTAAAVFAVVRLPTVHQEDALAQGTGIGVVFGVFAAIVWLRAERGRRAGWAVIALLLAAPQPLLAAVAKQIPHRASFDQSAALGLLGGAALIGIAVADLLELRAVQLWVLGRDDVNAVDAEIERARSNLSVSVALATVACFLVLLAHLLGGASYRLIR